MEYGFLSLCCMCVFFLMKKYRPKKLKGSDTPIKNIRFRDANGE